jgi:hypothetical protein
MVRRQEGSQSCPILPGLASESLMLICNADIVLSSRSISEGAPCRIDVLSLSFCQPSSVVAEGPDLSSLDSVSALIVAVLSCKSLVSFSSYPFFSRTGQHMARISLRG